MSEQVVELLPCPFCGSDAVLSLGETGDKTPWKYIECLHCGATAEPDFWNLRADIPAAQLVAAVREARREVWQIAITIATQEINAAKINLIAALEEEKRESQ